MEKSKKNLFSSLKDLVKKKDVKALQNELGLIFDKEYAVVKKKFLKEKKQIEKMAGKLLKTELDKAKKFIAEQKKEMGKLQKQLEQHIRAAQSKVTTGHSKGRKTAAKRPKATTAPTGKKRGRKKATPTAASTPVTPSSDGSIQ